MKSSVVVVRAGRGESKAVEETSALHRSSSVFVYGK